MVRGRYITLDGSQSVEPATAQDEWWVNLTFACGWVQTNEAGIITDTMPVLQKFRGQHISRLENWKPYIERIQIG